MKKKLGKGARSQYTLYKNGTNISDDSILCNNSIDDNFVSTFFGDVIYNVAVTGDDLINDDTVVVVIAICGIVKAPTARSLRL